MSRSQKWKDEWAFFLGTLVGADMPIFADAASMTVSRAFVLR